MIRAIAIAALLASGPCWACDQWRADISCQRINDSLVLALRRVTRAEAQRTMGAPGIGRGTVLHFITTGGPLASFVNVTFGRDGRASVVYAIDEQNAEIMWNQALMPSGCSDAVGSRLRHCH